MGSPVDLDGTIFEITPNWSMERNSEWEKETLNAKPLAGGVARLRILKEMGFTVVVLTARGQGCRKYTTQKLKAHGLWDLVDHIYHRPKAYEGVKSSVYKAAMIAKLQKKFRFLASLEDEEPNLQVMRQAGIPIVLDAKTWWVQNS